MESVRKLNRCQYKKWQNTYQQRYDVDDYVESSWQSWQDQMCKCPLKRKIFQMFECFGWLIRPGCWVSCERCAEEDNLICIQFNSTFKLYPVFFCSLCYVCLYSTLTGIQICVFLILDRREITSPGRRFILSVTAFALAFGKVIISAFDVAHKLSFFVWVPNCPRTFSPQCNVSLWNSVCSLKTLS